MAKSKVTKELGNKKATKKYVKVAGAESGEKPLKTAVLHRELLAALRELRGHIRNACEQVGCNRDTYYEALKDPDFARAVEHLKEGEVDEYEESLHRMRDAMVFPAVKYYLDTHGKKRGYGQQDQAQVAVNISTPDANNQINIATLSTEMLLQLKRAATDNEGNQKT